ncbi:putative quinol monooxygenase [Paenibacillus maysiensis]|uniref:putative quinol monooxygenase n=1 Tax=Paenibacillus maysiensis TaxID=1155954 RepID=UPI000470966F|nr:antibiotic biosynthesis monooxygenase [Paenibacillus maysiensis]
MLYVTACLNIISTENVDYIMKEFKDLENETLKEKGCIYFHVHLLDQEKIMLWEIWEDENALNNHHQMPHTVSCANKKLTEVNWLLKNQ